MMGEWAAPPLGIPTHAERSTWNVGSYLYDHLTAGMRYGRADSPPDSEFAELSARSVPHHFMRS